ncbi:MAG: hypothetical protein R3F11_02370 [Verrucomicrobiales bacterium]
MKTLLALLAAIIAVGFAAAPNASAGDCDRRYVGRDACGSALYAYRTFVGYDRCGHPSYRWVTRYPSYHNGCSNHGHCSTHRSYRQPSCNTPRYSGSSHRGVSASYSNGGFSIRIGSGPSYHRSRSRCR